MPLSRDLITVKVSNTLYCVENRGLGQVTEHLIKTDRGS